MFPSKNMFDYTNEINRLFPRPPENEIQMANIANYSNALRQSPLSSRTMANHSSSSADSMSPDVFPHLSPIASRPRLDRSVPVKPNLPETPFPNKRQRAIVGRKILGNTDHVTPMFDSPMHLSPVKSIDSEMDYRSWETMNQQTPPNHRLGLEQTKYAPNMYELFPAENRGYEFRTPVKSPVTAIPHPANMSPNSTASVSPMSSILARTYPTPPPLYKSNFVTKFRPNLSNLNQEGTYEKICAFCRKNGETPSIYTTHTVKEMIGNRNVVTCPILRELVCSTCGAFGDNAHTITYCPVLRSNNNGRPLQSTTITLKNTRVKSNGRKRY